MLPIIGMALDREQVNELITDLTEIMAQAQDRPFTIILICDPNPPKLSRPPMTSVDESDGPEAMMEAMMHVPVPNDVVRGSITSLGFTGEPDEVVDSMGYRSVGDPDNN